MFVTCLTKVSGTWTDNVLKYKNWANDTLKCLEKYNFGFIISICQPINTLVKRTGEFKNLFLWKHLHL